MQRWRLNVPRFPVRRGRHAIPELAVRRRGRRLALVGGVLALAAAAVPVAVWAGTPGSDPRNGQWVGGEVLAPGPEQLVLWKLPGAANVYGTCIDAFRAGPLHGPYQRSKVVADPVYGELNHLFAAPGTSDVRLAELSALNSRQYDMVDRGVQWSYVVNRQGGLSVTDAAAMLDQATKLAGPYTVTIGLPDDVRAGPTYTATVTVRSAANNMVPGARLSFSAANAKLSAATAVTDGLGRAHVSFTVAPGISTAYTLAASVQSWTNVATYAAPGEQTMLSAGPPSTQKSAKSAPIIRDRAVALVKVASDDPAQTPVAGYTFRIADSAGKVVLPSVVSGTAPVSLGRLTMGATYVATEIAAPPQAQLYVPVQNTTRFTVPDGSGVWSLVSADPRRPAPSVATQVQSERAVVGESLTDVVTVGGNDGEDATIEAARYGPVPVPRSGRCTDVTLAAYQSAPAVRVTAPVSGSTSKGNGQFTITSPPVTAPGCYGWAETVTLRPSGATASSPPTTPHESTLVSPPPAVHRPVPPTPPTHAQPPPPRPPHIVQAVPTPPLANTGAAVRVRPALAAGIGLIGAGSVLILAARTRRRA
jgi:hypothetical protein